MIRWFKEWRRKRYEKKEIRRLVKRIERYLADWTKRRTLIVMFDAWEKNDREKQRSGNVNVKGGKK